MDTVEDAAVNVEDLPETVQQALDEIDVADEAIDAAKQAKIERQERFVEVLRDHLEGLADREGATDAGAALLTTLYWDLVNVRIKDLQAASGLSGNELRRLVGPREATVNCFSCGTPTASVQRSRTGSAEWRQCTPCQQGPGELKDLFDFLADVLGRHRCDHRLTLTRVWATHNDRDPDAVVDELERRGGYCDCEVLLNVAPHGRRTPRLW